MILADKIIEERKKLGLSQEELAEKLNVSRQAVSKWESAQSVPDLQKIIALSELFSVSTDYLLKEEAVQEKEIREDSGSDRSVRRVSLEEANAYMDVKREASGKIALGVLFCILSPVLLIFLSGLSEAGIAGITDNFAAALGLSALFLFIAAAVFLFVRCDVQTKPYEYLEHECFETAYGVSGLVKEKASAFQAKYTEYLTLGVTLCVLSPLPLLIGSLINASAVLAVSLTALLLCIVAVGVFFIVRVSTVKGSYDILLQEGDFNKAEKKANNTVGSVSGIYWSVITAVYLGWSFLTGNWGHTWIIWPIAGVLCAPVMVIVKMVTKQDRR